MTQAFNLSQFANFVNSSGKADLTTAVTGTLPVANGGSGAATFSSGSVLLGSGTSSFGTVAPGDSGNLLTSNGTTWTSAAPPVVGANMVVFNASGTWTVPAGVTKALVWVYGNGGGGAFYSFGHMAYSGGAGGYAFVYLTGLSGAVAITITAANSGYNATTFGSYISCSGGTNANGYDSGGVGVNGAAAITSGTTLVSGTCGETFFSGSSLGALDLPIYASIFYRPGILNGTNYGRPGFYNTGNPAGSGAVAIQY